MGLTVLWAEDAVGHGMLWAGTSVGCLPASQIDRLWLCPCQSRKWV